MLYHFPGDHRILEQSLPRGPEIPCEEEREARFVALAAIREELLKLTCDSTEMEMLLRVCGGELSCRDLALALGIEPSTAWRTVQRRLQDCRFTRAAALAIESFERGQSFVVDVRRGEYAKKGACNPGFFSANSRSFPMLPSPAQTKAYLRKHARLLDVPSAPPHYFAGRIDSRFHLDIIRFLDDANGARGPAQHAQQDHVVGVGSKNRSILPQDRPAA